MKPVLLGGIILSLMHISDKLKLLLITDIVIEKCSDSEMDRFIRTALTDLPCDIYADCPDPVSTFDESDVYRQKCKKVCFLGVPLTGGDYNEERVKCKLSAVDAVCEALCRIAEVYGDYFNL